MNKKVIFFVEQGYEEVELTAPVDILRRGNVIVDIVSATDNQILTSSRNLKIVADKTIKEITNILEYDAIIVPGGMPGSESLKNNNKVINFFKQMYENDKIVAAICAAPIVLNEAGITKNKNITCYPTFNEQIICKNYDDISGVVEDGNVITAQGPALAIDFGFTILKKLTNKETSDKIKKDMLIHILKNNI